MPQQWSKSVTCPLNKKGDQMECANYRGISLLSCAYKVFSNVLYQRLALHAEREIGQYQTGLRRGKSAVDQIHVLRIILERAHEYKKPIHHLFVDFKNAYDSIEHPKLYEVLSEMGIPSKLICLIKMTMTDVRCIVGSLSNFGAIPVTEHFKGTMLVHQVVYLKAQTDTLRMNRHSCFECYSDCNRFILGQMKFPADDVEDGNSRVLAADIKCNISVECYTNLEVIPEENKILPEPATSSMSYPDYYTPGTYVLVRFPNFSKKRSTTSDYKYVCCIDEVDSNGSSLLLHKLSSLDKSNSQFVVKDNDVCMINK